MTDDKISKILKENNDTLMKRMEEMEKRHTASLTTVIDQMKTENNELKSKVDSLVGFVEIQPLLDLVSKFRTKIIQELINNKLIPNNLNEWSLMYDYLKKEKKRQIIDQTAESLGLSSEDWYTIQMYSHKVNNIKHPQPRISKEEACNIKKGCNIKEYRI